MIQVKASSCLIFRGLILASLVAATLEAEFDDPSGYYTMTVPGNSQGLVPVLLVSGVSFKETVTEVTAAGIRFADDIPASVFAPSGRGFADVRVGAMAGLAIPATGFSGNFLELERSPVGLISPGDFVGVRAEQTLGRIFGSADYTPLQTGENAEQADTLGIWDARTQTSRVFFFLTGQGWREVGKENEGDKASTLISFPGGIIVRRRAATALSAILVGVVPAPWEQRFHPVWLGRNLVSAPFSLAKTVSEFMNPLEDAPHTVTAGTSAPRSDTLRFTRSDGSLSPVIYFKESDTWRAVGSNEEAGGTDMSFSQCLDLQRTGGPGYIRFAFVAENALRQAQQAAVAEVPNTCDVSADGLTVRWVAEPGAVYQVQSMGMRESIWKNVGEPVEAATSAASLTFRPEGAGRLRVIKQ
jgi:hypothetical protein